jgi:hypothetical protein
MNPQVLLTLQLGTSAALFYGYVLIASIVIFVWLKYLKLDMTLVNMLCVYGKYWLKGRFTPITWSIEVENMGTSIY